MLKIIVRPVNALTLGYSYLKSSITGSSDIKGMPVSAGIEITNCCNLKCPECVTGSGQMTRATGFMKVDLFRKIMNELRQYLYNINLYFQGEPMMHPQFFIFLEIIGRTKTIVSTNGHYLSEGNAERLAGSGLRKLIVSFDGLDQETYSLYRKGGNVETVITGIRNVSKAIRESRSSLKLELQVLVNSHNESQIPLIRSFAQEVKADLRLKSMQIINYGCFEEWLPINENFRRYEKKGNDYRIKSQLMNRCLRLWTNPVITWDGKVVPCCFDKNSDHEMGDLTSSTLREIWEGKKYQRFRNDVLSGRKDIEICRNCTSGLKGVPF
jgi:radical SAM protein with 4Fe4S-binding SPASM domain